MKRFKSFLDHHPLVSSALLALAPFLDPRIWIGSRISDGTDTFFFSWLMAHHWRQWSGEGFANYFDTGILAPFPNSLLFSENGLGLAALGWPFHILGLEPAHAFFFVNLFGWIATAVTMTYFALKQGLTSRAALVATLFFVFSGFHMGHMFGHLQMAFGVFILLSFLGAQIWLKDRKPVGLAIVIASWAGAFYFNTYYFVFIAYSLPLWIAYLVWRSPAPERPHKMRTAAIGFLTATVIVFLATMSIAFDYSNIRKLLPNILFSEESRQSMQLDFASFFRAHINLALARRIKWAENSAYMGLGFAVLMLTYISVRFRSKFARPLSLTIFFLAFAIFSIAWIEWPDTFKTVATQILSSALMTAGAGTVGYFAWRRMKQSSTSSGFFLLFAVFWILVAMGDNIWFGYQPFSFFLWHAPILDGLRAIGRLFVLSNLGLAIFAGFIWDELRHHFPHSKSALNWALGLALVEMVGGTVWSLNDKSYDPTPVYNETHDPQLKSIYSYLEKRIPGASIYEFPTRSWTDHLRVYQYGAALRDRLHRLQGLTGYTPVLMSKTIEKLSEDEFQSEEIIPKAPGDIGTLIDNLPVHALIVHDGPVGTGDRKYTVSRAVRDYLDHNDRFARIDSSDSLAEPARAKIYLRRDDVSEIGFRSHPVLIHGIRELSSMKMPVPRSNDGAFEQPVPYLSDTPTRFSMLYPYFAMMPGADAIILELGPRSLPAEIVLRWAGWVWKVKPADKQVKFVFKWPKNPSEFSERSKIGLQTLAWTFTKQSDDDAEFSIHALYLKSKTDSETVIEPVKD